ncbi:O-methyltransferase [Streptomyces reniochalinae]|uniref:Methyltransferase n=1 Tax=Streptomyces reniochalinae TaxID=2250578 RepID=A0A367ECG2_9ACTN|nr:class I SAM-dependent methyltransferase [Streptomyces reniochalinae]RCG15736.1 methyltransferase [Streptomyces reniochalinae]
MVSTGALRDPRVLDVLERLDAGNSASFETVNDMGRSTETWSDDPFDFAELPLSVSSEIGQLIYLTARAAKVTRAVDFATSVGTSLIYLAAAVRDNGGGLVIGSEVVPAKVKAAQRNVDDAGLTDYVEIREGDARETLKELGGPVGYAIVDGFQESRDGWAGERGSSLALDVLRLLTPQLAPGAVLVNDNAEPDYLEHVRDPANGFRSSWIPVTPQLSEAERRRLGAAMKSLTPQSPLVTLMPSAPGLEFSVRD